MLGVADPDRRVVFYASPRGGSRHVLLLFSYLTERVPTLPPRDDPDWFSKFQAVANLPETRAAVNSHRPPPPADLTGWTTVVFVRNPFLRLSSAAQRIVVPGVCRAVGSIPKALEKMPLLRDNVHFKPQTAGGVPPSPPTHVFDLDSVDYELLGALFGGATIPEELRRFRTYYKPSDHSAVRLTPAQVAEVRRVYAADFEYAARHGIHYELPQGW